VTNTDVTGVVSSNAVSSPSLNAQFALASTPAPRLPLLSNDMVFVPGTNVGYVSANGADAVFRVVYDGNGNIASVGSAVSPMIDLNPTGIASPGENPTGLDVAHAGGFLLVANDVTRNVSLVDLSVQAVAGTLSAPNVTQSTLPATGAAATVVKGRRFFNTGTGRWSLGGQAWGACQSCHTDGLSDNVTWYFARGPRQSTSLDSTFAKGTMTVDQRMLNWSAINDELSDFEANVRGISGGVGAIVTADSTPPATTDRIDVTTACATCVATASAPQSCAACTNGNGNNGLNGSADQASASNGAGANVLGLTDPQSSADTEWTAVTSYVKAVRSPRAPTNLDATAVAAGAALFGNGAGVDGNCIGCHAGPKWTISRVFYQPGFTGTAPSLTSTMTALQQQSWPASSLPPASLLSVTDPAFKFMRASGGAANGAGTTALDQMLCSLRNVRTFGVAESGAGIAELRIDMATTAQGAGVNLTPASPSLLVGIGYNVPGLLGLSTGAPYFHAGNARTLEAVFNAQGTNGALFASHHQALGTNFLTQADPEALQGDVNDIVQFLLSIDDDAGGNSGNYATPNPYATAPFTIPAAGNLGGDFCALP
jgi:hypothetical protein